MKASKSFINTFAVINFTNLYFKLLACAKCSANKFSNFTAKINSSLFENCQGFDIWLNLVRKPIANFCRLVLHHFSGIAFGNPSRFVILSEAKNLKLLIINALDSSLTKKFFSFLKSGEEP
ncbi:MAG: hypothetical protein MUE85_00515 [Microscillaceae bacterium]|nr:hypothetical protein [Microscillaceae bacterium]